MNLRQKRSLISVATCAAFIFAGNFALGAGLHGGASGIVQKDLTPQPGDYHKLVHYYAHSGGGVFVTGSVEKQLDTMTVTCPVAAGCLLKTEIQVEVGNAPNGATPYEYSIGARIDTTCGLGCLDIQGLIRTDSQPDLGWVTGHTKTFLVVAQGTHTMSASVILPYDNMEVARWQAYYSVYK